MRTRAPQRSKQRTPVSQPIRFSFASKQPTATDQLACQFNSQDYVYSYPNPHCLTCRLPHPVHHCQPLARFLNPLDQDNIHPFLVQRNKSVK